MTFFRIIKFALQNILRNGWLSFVTVTMLSLTLLTVNVLVVFNVMTRTAVQSVEERLDVSVYFKDGTEKEIVSSARGFLLGLSQVKDAVEISPDEALARFKEQRAEDETALAALEQVEGNPFGYALVVTATTAQDFPFILTSLEHPSFAPYIEQKYFQSYEDIITSINRVTRSVRFFGLALSAIFLTISILIVMNTVRVAIYIYREEIAIMRLVGASSMFIRAPFWFEAILYSFLATVLSAAVSWPAIFWFEKSADYFFAPTNAGVLDFYLTYGWQVFLVQFLGLALLNILSASAAMRKYLRI